MTKLAVVKKLVAAYRKYEPMSAAIWIRQDEEAVWLVQVLPSLYDEPDVSKPVHFTASIDRPATSHIAGNEKSIRRTIKTHKRLARWVAKGQIIMGEDLSRKLIKLAEKSIR